MATSLIEKLAGIESGSSLADALATRAEIMRLSQAAHDAVIAPRDPGALSHGLRAALAARMSRQNGDAALAAHYDGCLARTGDRSAVPLAEPSGLSDDPTISAIVRHADMLTLAPREAKRSHIEALHAAGIGDADIVRLSELAAFVNYQARVIAGLRLLKGVR